MPNYAALQTKIQADHANATPEQIRDALNAKNIPAYKNIPTDEIKRYLILNDLWLPIKASAEPACVLTMDALNVFPYFEMGAMDVRNKVSAMMDALIAANLAMPFTTTDKAEILAMGDDLVSWADQNWPSDVTLFDILKVI